MASSSWLVWPLMVAYPVILSAVNVIWSPTAMCLLGIGAVAAGQAVAITYEIQRHSEPVDGRAVLRHLYRPEGFVLLGAYLLMSWHAGALPTSYYESQGRTVNPVDVVKQLLCQEFFQYVAHRLQHIYRCKAHRFHHEHHNPQFYDAFDGSVRDTLYMVIVPLFATAHTVRTANAWSYMTFGTLYANWLCLIHSDKEHAWDRAFQALGLGTPRDHRGHHQKPHGNFGHLFLWFDYVFGTEL